MDSKRRGSLKKAPTPKTNGPTIFRSDDKRFESSAKTFGDGIRSANVLIVGLGGLGCLIADYLVRAGVGRLTLLDYDTVDLSNLDRQLLYSESSIGVGKATSAERRLKEIDSSCSVNPLAISLNSNNTFLLEGRDLIFDCTDNSFIRYVINDYCVLNNRRLVSCGVGDSSGRVSFVEGRRFPCFRCLFPTKLTKVFRGDIINPPLCGIISSTAAFWGLNMIGKNLYPNFFYQQIYPYSGLSSTLNNIMERCYVCRVNDKTLQK